MPVAGFCHRTRAKNTHKGIRALIEGFDADYVLADKGYDSDAFIESAESQKKLQQNLTSHGYIYLAYSPDKRGMDAKYLRTFSAFLSGGKTG